VWGTPAASRRPTSFAQSAAGFAALQQALEQVGVPAAQTLIVMEATSSYWVALAVALHDAGYRVAVMNPRVIHHYAKSLPRRGKTDTLDAHVLLQFAAERQPATWSPPPAMYHDLRQRLVARDAMLEMRQQARNQRHALTQWPIHVASVVAQFDAIEAEMDHRITTLDAEIAALLQHGAWAESAVLLASIPGLGPTTVAWLLVATLNFELCATPEAAVAYCGLHPVAYDSGSSIHLPPRLSGNGHARLRRALYLAALSAARYNPPIKAFYDRLRHAGKPVKVARCAAARKLLQLAFAIVTKREVFDPNYAQRTARQRA
jgi:transposase